MKGFIESGINSVLKAYAPAIVDVAMRALFEHKAYAMIAGGQLRLMECGIAPLKAWEMSKACIIAFRKAENIEFGDPRYVWDSEAGKVIVQEMEIDHWDQPS